jgi:hypothetical protein
MNPSRIRLTPLALLIIAAGAGCSENDAKPTSAAVTIAPTATALAPVKPASMAAKKLVVDPATSKVDFLMDAPKEKIHGRVAGTTTGDISVDFMDLTKTTGLVTVDISGIEIFQTKADKDGKFVGEEKKDEKQNEHARNWLEISKDTAEDARKKNAMVQFSIRSIEVTGEKDLSKMTGAERKVTLKATGDFLLHGHKSEKTAELEATFHFEGDKPTSVTVKSVKPFAVDLAENEVKPRDAVGKLLLKGLDALAPKVAKEALVSFEYTAKANP